MIQDSLICALHQSYIYIYIYISKERKRGILVFIFGKSDVALKHGEKKNRVRRKIG